MEVNLKSWNLVLSIHFYNFCLSNDYIARVADNFLVVLNRKGKTITSSKRKMPVEIFSVFAWLCKVNAAWLVINHVKRWMVDYIRFCQKLCLSDWCARKLVSEILYCHSVSELSRWRGKNAENVIMLHISVIYGKRVRVISY